MREDDFSVLHKDDVKRVGLENELLSLEVEVLRAKVSEVDSLLAEKDALIVERNRMISEKNSVIAERNATVGNRDHTIIELRARLKGAVAQNKELKQAQRDLKWTLNRLRKTPLVGYVLARRSGFRRLADKYLRD